MTTDFAGEQAKRTARARDRARAVLREGRVRPGPWHGETLVKTKEQNSDDHDNVYMFVRQNICIY